MAYRCRRNQFTEQEYETSGATFWPIPMDLGDQLADLWDAGGVGAISLLPLLGLWANAKSVEWVHLPKEKAARLAGTSAKSVARAARILQERGLAESSLGSYGGRRFTQWNVSPGLAVPMGGDQRSSEPYFYFSARLIYGGAWSKLTAVQRLLYLALATQAHTYGKQEAQKWLKYLLYPGTSEGDLWAGFDQSPPLRLVACSYSALEHLTGVARSSLKAAVAGLKHPDVWPTAPTDPATLQFAPLSVYPSDGGSLIYHFRDHAEHWPWEVLNSDHAALLGYSR